MEQFGILTLGSRLKRLSDFLFTEVQQIYCDYHVPISSTYFPILRQLQYVGTMSVVELAEKLKVSHPAISKQVTKMLSEGLLEKVADRNDQRRTALVLSQHGVAAMEQAEPTLREMKWVLDQYANFSSENFLNALEKMESELFVGGLADKVLDRLREVSIVPFDDAHLEAFRELNMAWLTRYFSTQITEHDRHLLNNPNAEILEKGGQIFVAVGRLNDTEKVLGCVALLPKEEAEMEIMKLAVTDHCQAKGIAQRLLNKVFEHAQLEGVNKVTLETASCLGAAGALYRKNGFVEMAFPKASIYERADVYMEKALVAGL